MEPLSAAEAQALIFYLKKLSEELDNVVQLLQKRKAGKHRFLDLAATAQMNVDVMYQELLNDQAQECAVEAIESRTGELSSPGWTGPAQASNHHASSGSVAANSSTSVSGKHAAG